MAVVYEKIVAEDLNVGFGSVEVTMPAGGTQPGTQIGMHTFPMIGFSAFLTGPATVDPGGVVLVVCPSREWDVGNWYDPSIGRFQPTREGYFHVTGCAEFAPVDFAVGVSIYRNGSQYQNVDAVRSGEVARLIVSADVYLNGETDYLDLRVGHTGSVAAVLTFARLSAHCVGSVLRG